MAADPPQSWAERKEAIVYALVATIAILRDMKRRVPELLKVMDVDAFILSELNPALAYARNLARPAAPSAQEELMVPREATEAMNIAGCVAMKGNWGAQDIYRAMLAAAPKGGE